MNTKITIGSVVFSNDSPCVVIAEGCDNHNGSLNKAKEIAQAAKESGADMVKFQLHLPHEEMLRREMEEASGSMFSKWGSLWGFIEQNLLTPDEHYELMQWCNKIGIQYFCTPFSLKAAELLNSMGVEGFKIGSGETEDLPFIEEVAKMGKPIMLSTGMTEDFELDIAVNRIRESGGNDFPLMLAHCVSTYSPKNTGELHLGCIKMLTERYKLITGLSDHTPPEGIRGSDGRVITEESIMWAALSLGAKFVEKHFTLDRNTPDADSHFSHDPKTLKSLISYMRDAEVALNGEKKLFEEERPVWVWAKRSLVTSCSVKKGTILNRAMITSKRPGTGIRSIDYRQVLGKTLVRDVPENTMLKWEDLV